MDLCAILWSIPLPDNTDALIHLHNFHIKCLSASFYTYSSKLSYSICIFIITLPPSAIYIPCVSPTSIRMNHKNCKHRNKPEYSSKKRNW